MPFSTEIDRFVDDDSIAVNDRTFSVKEINEAISLAVSTSFPDEVWVKGDVQKLRRFWY